METLIIGEEQLRLKFKEKVLPKHYSLMLKALRSHTSHFSFALFTIFDIAIERDAKTRNRVLNLFRKKPKNADKIRNRILKAKEILKLF